MHLPGAPAPTPSMTRSHAPTPNPSPTDRREGGFFAFHGPWAPGVRLFRQMRFASKALVLTLAFMPLLGLLAWQTNETNREEMTARRDATRQHVEIAHGAIASAHEREKRGELSREAAQALARTTLSAMRYDKVEYFWINDMAPRMVMHPIKPELDGKDVGGMKDPNGFALFQGFVETVRKQGAGFVGYQWPKPGSDRPVDKISYVMGFEPWGWVVGSGVYVDDLRAAALARWQREGGVALAVLLLAAYLFGSFFKVMDGLTAIRTIRRREARERRGRTMIFALTANAMPEHAQASAEAGADGHLTKPITADALFGAVEAAAAALQNAEPPAAQTRSA